METTHRCKVCPEEALLDPRPECEGDEEELPLVLELADRGDKKPASLPLSLLLLAWQEPLERINKDGDEEAGRHRAGQVDAGHCVDLVDVCLEIVVIHPPIFCDIGGYLHILWAVVGAHSCTLLPFWLAEL